MSRTASKITLVCYDITNDKLRRKIDKCMKDFGIRLQYSMFICRLDANGVARCRKKLQDVLKLYLDDREPDDSLIIFERLQPDIADCLLGARIERNPAAYEVF